MKTFAVVDDDDDVLELFSILAAREMKDGKIVEISPLNYFLISNEREMSFSSLSSATVGSGGLSRRGFSLSMTNDGKIMCKKICFMSARTFVCKSEIVVSDHDDEFSSV